MAAQQLAVNVVDFAKARLPELEALDEELDKNNRDAPRHLRRRARSHTAPFLAKKNPNNPNPTRRARRKPSELLKAHDPHAADVTLRFLETHVWHAKRFAMVDEGGWRRPDYRRDRGLKAALRSLRTAALVFDATAERMVEVAPREWAVGAEGSQVPGGLVRFEVRGCRARDVVATLIGAAPSDAPMALDVPDPRRRPSTGADAERGHLRGRLGASFAVAARTDDKIMVGATRMIGRRRCAPCLVVPRPRPARAAGRRRAAELGPALWRPRAPRVRPRGRAQGAAPRRRRGRGRGHGRVFAARGAGAAAAREEAVGSGREEEEASTSG